MSGPASSPGGNQFRLPALSVPADPATGLSWKLQIVVFLIAAAAVISRRPDALFDPQFFAEDGTIWFAQAYSFGWFTSLLHSYNGYFQTLPRLAAGLALLVPLRFAPLLLNLAGLTVQVLPVNVLLSRRCREWAPLPIRGWMAIAYIALPNTREINVTVTNAQWHLALLTCLIVLATTPVSAWWRIFDCTIISLSGLSGPFGLMLAAIAVVFWWVRHQRWTLVVIGILALTSAIQLWTLIQTAASIRPKVGLGATPELLLRLVAGEVYLGALLGEGNDPAHQSLWLLRLVAALGTAVLVYCLRRAGLELKLLVALSLLVLVAGLRSPMVSMTTPQWQVLLQAGGLRYWFLPMIGLAWALIWCALVGGPRAMRAISVAGLLVMLAGIIGDWRYEPYTDMNFPQNAAKFEAAAPGTAVTIPIYPPGLFMTLIKK